ncbi:AMP-binding protein, partial [Streptomyces noursei]|uniref:AMP-binding protein n=1 Tax=Streptomyces noursei TaxID=1971 RepID=UPI0030F0C2A2
GGTCVLAPTGHLEPSSLEALLTHTRATAMWLTAGLFTVVAEEHPHALTSLRQVWAGGDVLSPAAVRRVHEHCPHLQIVNGYGPTETTTFAATHHTQPGHSGPIPIGTPLANTRAHVLDAHLRLVPPGVPGELYLSG